MTSTKALTVQQLYITESDFDRLSEIIDSPLYRQTHAPRVAGLKEELSRGRVVPGSAVPRNVVTMRSRVRVREQRSGERETYTLVFPDEADIDQNKLSVLAPLGRALLGAHVGQIVTVDAPAGPRRLKVERILYQPEAAGDLHLYAPRSFFVAMTQYTFAVLRCSGRPRHARNSSRTAS